MRVKLSICILSAFLLWSSLLAPGYQIHFSNHQEIKIACQAIVQAVIADEDFIWKKSSAHVKNALPDFTFSKIHSWGELSKTVSNCSHKSAHFYLLFKVLRN